MNKAQEIRELAESLMAQYGLHGWRFQWDSAKRRYGCCKYRARLITLSWPLAEVSSMAAIENTIRHEIAHALTPPDAHHGPIWKAKCAITGAIPERCSRNDEVEAPWELWCPQCEISIPRHRRPSRTFMHSTCKTILILRGKK